MIASVNKDLIFRVGINRNHRMLPRILSTSWYEELGTIIGSDSANTPELLWMRVSGTHQTPIDESYGYSSSSQDAPNATNTSKLLLMR